jgi:beta-galactosidase/beta-glucuronidase
MIPRIVVVILSAALLSLTAASAADNWAPAENPLTTPWTAKVNPARPLPEHPRPQMERLSWESLNGLWDYAVTPKDSPQPSHWEGRILVPYPIESALSGVKRALTPADRLWYRRTFSTVALGRSERMMLNFGAVDWRAEVFVNGKAVGSHEGGYDPFSLDITEAMRSKGEQELVVSVWDPTNTGNQPRGKQILEPNGIWYTAVSGIWQTVWLEPVPKTHVERLSLTPDLDSGTLKLWVHTTGGPAKVKARAMLGGREVGRVAGEANAALSMKLNSVQAWSPESPTLYEYEVSLSGGDKVTGYFGLRKIEVRNVDGAAHLFLNNRPVFMIGPLDQGWWPDGLYTAPTDEALRFDIDTMKRLGFNMARKHVKVEPARWYYWCDKLGLMVWQDMPSGFTGRDKNVARGVNAEDARFTPEETGVFQRELAALIATHENSPSIIGWVPFNEGWGQHDTNNILQWVKKTDPTRLVDAPSGWEDRGWGDMKDMHKYPGPEMYPPMADRATVLGEFGGLGLPVEGYLWWNKRNWGYRTFKDRVELQAGYEDLIAKLRPMVAQGLSAAVYTQLTDVEGEVNGLLTYDRKLTKFDADRLARLHQALIKGIAGAAVAGGARH